MKLSTACILLGMLLSATGCNGVLKSMFESQQTYAPEPAAHTNTVVSGQAGDASETANQPIAPVSQPQQVPAQTAAPQQSQIQRDKQRDQQTQAVEQAGGFFASLAAFLPPPWNLVVPGVITTGVGWFAAKRRYKAKQA